MPAWRLNGQQVTLNRYDVGGQDSDSEAAEVRCGSEITLAHMGPPLRYGDFGNPVQTAGAVPLTVDQRNQVRVFLDEVMSEYKAQNVRDRSTQYIVHPHVRPPDERFSYRRFSCAGFVIEAYDYAGIELLSRDETQRPLVTMETLVRAYPAQAQSLQQPRIRSFLGIGGPEPWPVVLAGYILNALNRTLEEIEASPYVPVSGDEYFPSKRDVTVGKSSTKPSGPAPRMESTKKGQGALSKKPRKRSRRRRDKGS